MAWKTSIATSAGPTVFGPLLYAGRVADCIRAAAELGYDGIEISLKHPDELDKAEVKRLLDQHGLRLSAIGSGRVFLEDKLSFSDPDEAVRRQAVERIQSHIDLAAEFGAPVIIGLVRGARSASGDLDRDNRLIAECVRQCADHAAQRNSWLLIEPCNRYETVYQNNAQQTLDLLDLIDRPNVKVLLDCFHMNIEEVSIPASIRKAGKRLGHFHIVDSNRWAPGWGHIDYGEIIAALREIDYQGFVSFEALPLPNDLAACTQAIKFVKMLETRPS